MIDIFKRDERLKDYSLSNRTEKDDEMPRQCRRNEKLYPPKAIGSIEDFLKKFETTMHVETGKNNSTEKLKFNKNFNMIVLIY